MQARTENTTGWERRKSRVRKKVKGTAQRPRLNVYRSNKHIYAQVIDDERGKTIAAASTKCKELAAVVAKLKGLDAAKKVGELCAKRALEAGVKKVVFDRSGYLYHGRVQFLADGARAAGLDF